MECDPGPLGWRQQKPTAFPAPAACEITPISRRRSLGVKLFEALANTQERREIRNSVRAVCDRFDDRYWAEKDRLHEFPHEPPRSAG